MWPSAKCINSYIVRTPSSQLGVLQSLQGSFQLVRSHLLTSLVHTSGGIQSEAATSPLSTKAAQVGHKGVNPFTILAEIAVITASGQPTMSGIEM